MKLMSRALVAASALLAFTLSCSSSSDNTTNPPVNKPAPIGTITTWAGTGHKGFNDDGLYRTKSELYWPQDIQFTGLGTFIADWNNHRIRRVNADGTLETIVGTPSIGDGPPYPNEGGDIATGWPGTECDLNHPTQVLELQNGKLLLVCWHNHKLRTWDPDTGLEQVLIGRGPGCTGDGELESSPTALLNQPPHAVQASDGSILIMDQRNQCVRKIDPNGMVSTVVCQPCDPVNNPNNDPNIYKPGAYTGDGGAPTDAQMNQPSGPNPNPPGGGLALDSQGRLYFSDTFNNVIRMVDFKANVITTVVGTGGAGFSGDGGDPLQATLYWPLEITFGPDGKLYIADRNNNAIRCVDFDANVITTVAGTGVQGYSGDGGPATQAKLYWPYGVTFDQSGDMYICDTYNNRIRRVKMHE